MANRLLPFRQYNEHDVVNLFSLDTSSLTLTNMTHSSNGAWDAGVIVKVSNGDMTQAPVAVTGAASSLQSYLGKTDYPHVGGNHYPEVPLKVVAAAGTDIAVGVALRQTIAYDENGEKLLYYKQKLLELQGVLPGEAVPVLTKGIVTVGAEAVVSGSEPTAGAQVALGAGGKFRSTNGNTIVGTCLAVGNRSDVNTSDDYFAGDGSTGAYYVIKIDL